MQADPHPWCEAVLPPVAHESPLDVDGALDGVTGALEGHEEAVAGMVDLVTLVLRDGRAKLLVMPAQDLAPGLVADEADQVGGADDVGEHERPGHPICGSSRRRRSRG